MMDSTAIKNLLISATATGFSETITMPIGTIKTNYQNSSQSTVKEIIKKIYSQHGISGFYAAWFPATSSQMLSLSSKYTIYRSLEELQLPYTNKIMNGMIGGITTSIITHPFDFIKIHLQMSTSIVPVIKEAGIGVIYRGYTKTFLRTCISSASFFPLFDYSKKVFENSFLASISSGIISTIIMHPIDYLKTRQIYNLQYYQGWNPGIYYKGLAINLVRIVPNFAIIMTTIDYLNHKF